jgi:hypothetical protein
MKPGLYEHISAEQYHADELCSVPTLSASIAHTLVSKSPLHAWAQHPRLGGRGKKPTAAMDLGSVVHALLLGKGKQFAVVKAPEGEPEFEDFKKKAAREARDSARAQGLIPMLQKHLDDAIEVADGIRLGLEEWGIELTGQSEVTAIWEERADDGTIVLCRGGLDHLLEAQILDLKIVRSSHPKACQSHMFGFGGDIQSAAYVSALDKLKPTLAGRVPFRFLFCEAEFPHAVTPVDRAGSMRDLGERRWRRAINRWAWCTKNDRWPAYVTEVYQAEAPAWAHAAELELSFSGDSMNDTKPDGPSAVRVHRLDGETDDGNEYGEDVRDVF